MHAPAREAAVTAQRPAIYLAVGLAQGAALWALRDGTGDDLHGGLLHLALAAPLAWYLLAGSTLAARARVLAAACIGMLFFLLGAHAANTAAGTQHAIPFSFAIAPVVLGYLLVALVAAYDVPSRRIAYPQLFEFAWRNALLVGVAGALTGILWLLLWAAAWMMDAIGIHALTQLLQQSALDWMLSTGAFGFAIAQALNRAEALAALRRFWLALNTWFLPLALALALVWLASLVATGVEPLFATRRAALALFWFAALAILFLNAAWQDGSAVPYGRRLAGAVRWAWLAIPLLAALGLWALALRVRQHGWTVDRIWAALVGSAAFLYAAGYCLGRKPGGWMAAVPRTNISVAALLCLAIVLLLGPLADARKLAVASQVGRLRSGAVSLAQFDFAFLRTEAGSYGRAALDQLAQAGNVPPAVRSAAAEARRDAADGVIRQDSTQALATLRDKVLVLPRGETPDPALLAWLSRPRPDYNERACLADAARCVLWLVDLDRAGGKEAVLLWDNAGFVNATVYAAESAGWRRQGELAGPRLPLAEWQAAIKSGRASTAPPRWLDLQVGTGRYTLR